MFPSGESFQMPGFCMNRLTDFVCLLWLPLSTDYGDNYDEINTDNYELWTNDNTSYGDYFLTNNASFDDSFADLAESTDHLYNILSPIILLIGSIGNILSAIVMRRLAMKLLSSYVYLCLIALFDLIILYTRCGNEWLVHLTGINLMHFLMISSETLCKVCPFIFNFMCHYNKWIFISVIIETHIALKYSSRFYEICTLKRARAVLLLLIALLVCANIHYFWSFELITYTDYLSGLLCAFVKRGHQYSAEFQEIIWPIMDLLIADVIPYIITTLIGFLILIQNDTAHNVTLRQLKRTILVMSVLSIMLTLPQFVSIILWYIINTKETSNNSFELEERQNKVHMICANLEYCFLSCKFFIYVSTSGKFRKELVKMFKKSKQKDLSSIMETSSDNQLKRCLELDA